MSSFAGVSVLADGELCPATASTVGTSTECGYHLLVVQDYSRIKDKTPTGESVTSRPFMVGGHCWIIKYYPSGESQSCADFISLFVSHLHGDDEKPVEAKFVFSFIDEVEMQNPVYIAENVACRFTDFSWGSNRFMRRDALEQLVNLTDDSFTIRCDIMVCNTKDDAAATKVRLPDMCHDLNNLFQTEAGADVTFEVGGEKFAAHRCVLAARSKVFMAQLFGPMKETSSVIQIKDMEAKVFKAFLSFIYTDTFPDMKKDDSMEEDKAQVVEQRQEVEAAEDKMSGVVEQGQEEEAEEDEMWLQWWQGLFVAADRYDVQRLKFICERQLSEEIGVSSVMSTLALAEQHHCQGLKEACFKFIQVQSPSCLQTVMATDGWDYVVSTHPSVLKELIAKLTSSNQQK